MDFNQMLLAHSNWKNRLKDVIQKNERIDVKTAGTDDKCELGKWLYGEGTKFASLNEYKNLKAKHAAFHTCVAKVATEAASLPKESALALLDPFGEYGRASSECINAITALRSAVG